jgi:hypothetical protein
MFAWNILGHQKVRAALTKAPEEVDVKRFLFEAIKNTA